MASGDLIPGDVLVKRRDNSDNEVKVVGRFDSAELNTFASGPDGKIYLNATRSSLVSAPSTARVESAPNAVFEEGEEILVQLEAGTNPANDLDVSGDQSQLRLRYIEVDLNRGTRNTQTFKLSDNEISTDPDTPVGEPVTFFRDTVGSSRRVFLAGLYEAKPAEA